MHTRQALITRLMLFSGTDGQCDDHTAQDQEGGYFDLFFHVVRFAVLKRRSSVSAPVLHG